MKSADEWSKRAVEFNLGFIHADLLIPFITAIQKDSYRTGGRVALIAAADIAERLSAAALIRDYAKTFTPKPCEQLDDDWDKDNAARQSPKQEGM